jgi:BMFP domain-containing protein YqiC
VQIAHLQDAAASAMSIANQSIFSGRTDALKQYSDLEAQIQALQAKLNDSVQQAAADKFSATLQPASIPNIPGQGQQLGPSGPQQFDEITKQASASISANAKQISDTVESNHQQLAQMASDTQTSIEKQVSEWEDFNAKIAVLLNSGALSPAEAAARQSAELDTILSPVSVGAEDIAKNVKDSSDKMSQYAKEAARNIQDAFANFLFDPFGDGLKGMLSSFVTTLEKITAQAAASKILESIGSQAAGAGGVIGDIAGFFGAKPTPHAGGGPVMAGMPYLVGESGPELMVPGVSGSIVPNHGLGGVTVNQTVDARGSTPDAVALLPAAMQQARRQAVADVLALNRQGKLGRRS